MLLTKFELDFTYIVIFKSYEKTATGGLLDYMFAGPRQVAAAISWFAA
jgi:hypothetical protein